MQALSNHLSVLEKARSDNVISHKSYQECLAWVEDPNLDSAHKVAEISQFYQNYLQPRAQLAQQRSDLQLKHTDALEQLQAEGGQWGRRVEQLLSDTEFMDKLHLEQREALVAELTKEVKQVEQDLAQNAAGKWRVEQAYRRGVISKKSYERWVKDIEDPHIDRSVKRKNFAERFEKDILRREAVASKRQALLKAKGLTAEGSLVNQLKSDRIFNEKLTIAEREELLHQLSECLPIKQKLTVLAAAAGQQINNAKDRGAISSQSAVEWIAWINDPKRDLATTLASLENTLPAYLLEREQLALRRETLLKGSAPELQLLQTAGSPQQQRDIATLQDDQLFLQGADITDRSAIVTRIEQAVSQFTAPIASDISGDLNNVPPDLMPHVINIQVAIASLPPEYQPLYKEALEKGYDTLEGVMNRVANRVKNQGENANETSRLDDTEEAKLKQEDAAEDLMPATDHFTVHLDNSDGQQDVADARAKARSAKTVNYHFDGRRASSRQTMLEVIGVDKAAGDRSKQISIANVNRAKQAEVVNNINTELFKDIRALKAAGVELAI